MTQDFIEFSFKQTLQFSYSILVIKIETNYHPICFLAVIICIHTHTIALSLSLSFSFTELVDSSTGLLEQGIISKTNIHLSFTIWSSEVRLSFCAFTLLRWNLISSFPLACGFYKITNRVQLLGLLLLLVFFFLFWILDFISTSELARSVNQKLLFSWWKAIWIK